MAKKNTYPRTLAMITQFKNELVVQMKKNLEKHNASGTLSESIEATETTIVNDNLSFSIEMADYYDFVDKGVKGADPSGIYKNNPDKQGVQRAPNSPYSYKTKMPPPSKMDKWSVRKGIAPRDSKGRFLSRKGINFAIAKSIFHQGLKPTLFFTKAYNKYFTPQFELDLMVAYSQDLEENLR